MKRTKNLIILCVALIVICAAIAIVKGVEKHIDKINTVDEEIYAIDTENVTQVSWTKEGTTLEFVKTEDEWKSTDDDTFPVNQESFYDFLDNFSSIHASFIIENVEDFSQYGLDKPEAEITISTGEDSTVISLGTFSTMDSKRYITLGNGTVYLIDTDLMDSLSTDRDEFMQHASIALMDQVTEFKVSGDNSVIIKYDAENKHSYTDSFNYYLVDNDEYKALSASFARTYINLIKNISLKDYATYNASTKDLSEYGLDKPAFTCEVKGDYTKDDTTVENSSVVYIGKTGSEENENLKLYARVDDSEIIYNVDSGLYDSLLAGSYDTLRPLEVVSANSEYITSMDFDFEGNEYRVNVDKSEEETTYTIGEEKVDPTDIINYIKALSLSEVNSEAEGSSLEFSFKINQDYNNYNTLTIDIYRYDGDSVVVKFNGETLGLMDRSYMVDLKESVTKMILNLGKIQENS